eukprot:COSAG01_NODE_4121_length_5332_cov_13.928913_8_plen_252_part_01
MADTQNCMLRLVKQTVKNAVGIHAIFDNRFMTPLFVMHCREMGVYLTGTIRMNLFPLKSHIKSHLIPSGWEGKNINDTRKAEFRTQPANLVSYGPITVTACFDTGLTRQCTTLPNLAFQDKTVIEKQRRVFAELKSKVKLAAPHIYTADYNAVDVVDHCTVMNQMALQSNKWTWNPLLRVFEFAKVNTYAAHVALCADYNKRRGFTSPSTDELYLTPLPAKEFYRKWGLLGMRYRGKSGYWFEDKIAVAQPA